MKQLIFAVALVFGCYVTYATAAAPEDTISFAGFTVFDSPQEVLDKSKDFIIITDIPGLKSDKQINLQQPSSGRGSELFPKHFTADTKSTVFDEVRQKYANALKLVDEVGVDFDHPRFKKLEERYRFIQLQDKTKNFMDYMNFIYLVNEDGTHTPLSVYVFGNSVAKVPEVFDAKYGTHKVDNAAESAMKGMTSIARNRFYWEKGGTFAIHSDRLQSVVLFLNQKNIDALGAQYEKIAQDLVNLSKKAEQNLKDQI